MASLIIVAGPSEGDYYPLSVDKVVIGRDEQCEIQIVDDLVSREHLSITADDKARTYTASDLNSANGVIINGHQVTQDTELADGDKIEIGASKLLFTFKEFPHRASAWDYYKLCGEDARSTLSS